MTLKTFYNPFKFEEVVRKGNALLIKCKPMGTASFTFTVAEILSRIEGLRIQDFPDIHLTEELKAVEEIKRERERDNWPEEISYD